MHKSFISGYPSTPFHFLTKVPVRILMNPARHTSSTPNSSSTRSIVPSNSARLPYSLWSTTCPKLKRLQFFTRVWMPASDALFRPWTPGLLEMTTTISAAPAGRLACSISACKLRAHDPRSLFLSLELLQDALSVRGRHHQHGAQAAVEGAGHLLLAQAALLVEPGEHGGDAPPGGVWVGRERGVINKMRAPTCQHLMLLHLTQVGRQPGGQHPGDVLQEPPPCDVSVGFDGAAAEDRQQQAAVDLGGSEQNLAWQRAGRVRAENSSTRRRNESRRRDAEVRLTDGPPRPAEGSGGAVAEAGPLQDSADQAEAVAVDPGGGQSDQQVALRDVAQPGQQRPALHRAHAEPGQVVLSRSVDARHFGRLATLDQERPSAPEVVEVLLLILIIIIILLLVRLTQQSAAGHLAGLRDAADHRRRHGHVEAAAGEVVEEEERLGALSQHVVHAHGHQVLAEAAVAPARLGDLRIRVGVTENTTSPTLSLVPTPSVPDTRMGSTKPAAFRWAMARWPMSRRYTAPGNPTAATPRLAASSAASRDGRTAVTVRTRPPLETTAPSFRAVPAWKTCTSESWTWDKPEGEHGREDSLTSTFMRRRTEATGEASCQTAVPVISTPFS
ncbi:hypothetical protein EYF80_033346 [Liparis tanakae]|uniref:Uncharacterized protein n=1 Tax=Liparis tanakae TaxID=230148 RepID=A0A4Z2GSJ7_9TELE|nr:hypothetical protein EYF80_033346 [Liparis tanakae]